MNETLLGQYTIKEVQEKGTLVQRETVSILSGDNDPEVLVNFETQTGNSRNIDQESYPSLNELKKYISSQRDELNRSLNSSSSRLNIATIFIRGGLPVVFVGLIGVTGATLLSAANTPHYTMLFGSVTLLVGGLMSTGVGAVLSDSSTGKIGLMQDRLERIDSIDQAVNTIKNQS